MSNLVAHNELLARVNRPDLFSKLHPKQYAVATSTAKRITNVCGRREGKTTRICRNLLKSADKNAPKGEDESITPYIAPTKNQAKRLMWGKLQVTAKAFQIPMTFNSTDLIAKHDNGAEVWICGADDDRDVERLRGFSYREVEIDEGQAVGADMDDFIEEVLDPALTDFDGTLRMSGTPNPACIGYFYEASTGQLPGWVNFTGTVLDNPYFPKWRNQENWQEIAKAWLTSHREGKGWSEDHPTFQREWRGKWVRDEGGMVYKYDSDLNDYIELPEDIVWQHVLGIDFGFDDAFAIVAWAFSEDFPDVWERETYKVRGETVSHWGEKIVEFEKKYNPVAEVADTGALGKAITKEINQRFSTALTPAEKKDKYGNIELMNSDLRAGRVHVLPNSPLAKEWMILQWDEDRKKEDPRFSNDASDGGLYGYREAKHWLYEPPEILPEIGTPERANLDMARIEEEEAAAFANPDQHWWER